MQGLPHDAVDLLVAGLARGRRAVALDLRRMSQCRRRWCGSPWRMRCRPRQPCRTSPAVGHHHRHASRWRVVVEGIAPEDIRFSPGARDEDEASFLGYVKRATASDLAKLGLGEDEIDDAGREHRPPSAEETRRGRHDGLVARQRSAPAKATASVRCGCASPTSAPTTTAMASPSCCALSMPMAAAPRAASSSACRGTGPAPIALATPILMPHALIGRCLFDQMKDLQQLGSVITRSLLDNLYLVNRPRPVISDHVNIDSLIDWTPGSPIRLRAGARPGDNHVAWLQVPNVTAGALTALEHLASVRENRTGVSRYNQGLDADSLNKTLGGLDRIMSASQQRQDLIARVFAEPPSSASTAWSTAPSSRAATGPVPTGRAGPPPLPTRSPPVARRHGPIGRRRGHRQPRAGAGPPRDDRHRPRRS